MKSIIITIGDEITSGHILNTNAAWIAEALETAGVTPERTLALRDDPSILAKELKKAAKDYALVLITGGLGATHDDVTKHALAKAFKAPLLRDENSLRQVKSFFRKLGKPAPEASEGQADVPAGFTPLANSLGTAPGLMLDTGQSILIAMPGVPHEMKGLMEKHVLPKIKKLSAGKTLSRTILRVTGIGESSLAALMEKRKMKLPEGVALAYLPAYGLVDLRLSTHGSGAREAKRLLDSASKAIRSAVGEYVYGTGDQTLEEVIGEALVKRKLSLASAESCTGGLFASRITSTPGASRYFMAGAVCYSNESKEKLAGVRNETLVKHGAVSSETAAELAEGIRKTAGADIGISSTGVAGPSGGTREKPVGLIYVGLATPDKTETIKLKLGLDRRGNQERTVNEMLTWLWHTVK